MCSGKRASTGRLSPAGCAARSVSLRNPESRRRESPRVNPSGTGVSLPGPGPRKCGHKENAQQQIWHGGRCVRWRDGRARIQHCRYQDESELLDHARDHQRSESHRVRPNHEERDLPGHRDREEAIEEVRVFRWRGVRSSGHVAKEKERREPSPCDRAIACLCGLRSKVPRADSVRALSLSDHCCDELVQPFDFLR